MLTTFRTLQKVKANKATGLDNIPWVLRRNHAYNLAPPLTDIFMFADTFARCHSDSTRTLEHYESSQLDQYFIENVG